MWQIFEIAAMIAFIAACGLGILSAMKGQIRYALISLFLATINGAVIFVARLAQAGGL